MTAADIRQALAATAIVLAVLAAIVGSPVAPAPMAARASGTDAGATALVARHIGAIQLAAWIREGARDVRVLDLRSDSAYESFHVPLAQPADFSQLDTIASQRKTTVVLYSDDDVRDAQAWANVAARGHPDVYVLSGGMPAWMEEVMDPVLHGDSADYVAALSRYFGGVPHTAPASAQPARRPRNEMPSAATATTDEFGESRRRGC